MTTNEIMKYEEYIERNKDRFNTRIFGSYLRYLDRYLHDKESIVDGMMWKDRMEHEPMPQNVFLCG